jgi:hypothetical protein
MAKVDPQVHSHIAMTNVAHVAVACSPDFRASGKTRHVGNNISEAYPRRIVMHAH